jgi:MoaA/NifB/PqqE/SkfB family radical SAM enzyme
MKNRPVYEKHNSFVEIRYQHKDVHAEAMKRVAGVRSRNDLVGKMSEEHQQVFNQVCADLLDPDPQDNQPRFFLSSSVVEEIATYVDSDLPSYLVHRYRYEIYPQKKILDEYPPYLQIEPTSICNFRCVFCFETDPTFTDKSQGYMGQMAIDLFKHIIDQAVGNVEFISLASRGEPLICKDIIPMLEYTRGKFLNLKINTNASLLDEAKCHAILKGGVKTVVFSADAAEEPLYSELRVNGDLSVVLKNIEMFQKIRQTQYPDLSVITRVSGVKLSDEQDIDSMQTVWGSLVDQVAFVQYNPWENVYNQPANGLSKPCSDLWRRMFVWWDGKSNPCDVDYKSTLSQGSINEFSLSELWRSYGYETLRGDHIKSKRETRKPCTACTVV